jgi:transposase-like protein
MSRSNRNNPKRAGGSESRYTFYDFEEDFPDDAACLDWLVGHLYPDGIFCPKCQRVTKHHRVKTRTCYACQFCGHQEYPMRLTIFEDSATSLKLWFHAFFLMAQTRCGISAKQLEREIGVTYKTAWRMFHKIRSLLSQDGTWLAGTVEMDEAWFGGEPKWKHTDKTKGRVSGGVGGTAKTPVFGMAQRSTSGNNGRVAAFVVGDVTKASLLPHVVTKVLPHSTVYTDEAHAYQALPNMGYQHDRVYHSEKVYVSGDVHVQTIEGFWATCKRGIRGVYHAVGDAYLQTYLDEYVFRYNNREATGRGMFDAFLGRIAKAG